MLTSVVLAIVSMLRFVIVYSTPKLGTLIFPPIAISTPMFNNTGVPKLSPFSFNVDPPAPTATELPITTLDGRNSSVLLINVLLFPASINPIDSYGANLHTLISSSEP